MINKRRKTVIGGYNSRVPIRFIFGIMIILLMAACRISFESPSQDAIMGVVFIDERLGDYVDRDMQPMVIAEGFLWSEGPLWLEARNALIFADVPANTVYEWKANDSLRVYIHPSGYTGEDARKMNAGSNGMALDASGQLILCQHGDRQVVRMTNSIYNPSSEFETIADQYAGKRFNSPNDICIASNGALFFTDPPYGLDDPAEAELSFSGVYMVTPEKEVVLLIDSLTKPNGIALSPKEDKLYIAVSDPEGAVYHSYDLDEDFQVVGHKLIFDATYLLDEGLKGLPDGMKVHSSGTLFATGPGGVLVFSPGGEWLGTIRTGDKAAANVAFNSDESILFITATDLLLQVPIKKSGHPRSK